MIEALLPRISSLASRFRRRPMRFVPNPRWLSPLVALPLLTSAAFAAGTNWTFQADLTLRETYDSNVYLQDYEPSPLVADAALPFQESFITTVTPKVGFAYKPGRGFNVSGSYAP